MRRISLKEICDDLVCLQSQLTSTVNELWRLKFALVEARHRGENENEFLVRRLLDCQTKSEARQEELLQELRLCVESYQTNLLVFGSEDDVETALKLRASIRYLQNAFDQDLPLGPALKRIRSM
jgi:hypothetical protein